MNLNNKNSGQSNGQNKQGQTQKHDHKQQMDNKSKTHSNQQKNNPKSTKDKNEDKKSDKTKVGAKKDPKTKKICSKSEPKKEKSESEKTKNEKLDKKKKQTKDPKTEVVKPNLKKTDKKTLSPASEIQLSVEKIKKLEDSGYKQLKTIGKGSYGQVFKATSAKHNKEVALKVVDLKRLSDVFLKKYTTVEIELMKKLSKHKNVITFFEVIEATEDHLLYISMEFCSNGDLFDYIIRRHYIPEREACLWFKQLISGVHHIHRSGYAHRDLKCENLLLDDNYNIKIVDFGFCCKLRYVPNMTKINGKNGSNEEFPSNTYCGSIIYSSPELLRGMPYFPTKTDIWSCGIILYVMLFGSYPNDGTELERFIQLSEHCIEAPESPVVSEECKQLVKNILVDEQNRYSTDDIRDSDWFKKEWSSIDSTINTKEYFENLNIQRQETLEFVYTPDKIPENVQSEQHSELKLPKNPTESPPSSPSNQS